MPETLDEVAPGLIGGAALGAPGTRGGPVARTRRIGLIVARSDSQADGIRDYTHRLGRSLRELGVAAEIWEWTDGRPVAPASECRLDALDAVVLQYNPFSFGRWGFAPGLPRFLAGLRRRPGRPRIAVMFHETYVDMNSPSWVLMGGWQRGQLRAVQACADVCLCSIQPWTERLRRSGRGGRGGRAPVHHLPVASNLPDARTARVPARERLGADEDTIVLSCMGLRHPGRLAEHVLGAAQAIGARRRVLLFDLGPGEPGRRPLGGDVELCATGFLDEREVAEHIAASDIFLAPYRDGVSTRRTTVMAALQNGVPVLGTAGHLSDDVLTRAPELTLTGPDAPEDFADAAAALADDPERRARLGAAGRALYERCFDWPVLAERLLGVLDA
ncbi:MAG: glycosyltransferase [Solirubrobacterales bacterium]|nr:glycosyltransferase [Solirubrobacterales bacterium]